jgi:hypothetical protein
MERFESAKREKFYQDIESQGFIIDNLLGSALDLPVYGLNIACAWPLPIQIKDNYEQLYSSLNDLSGVYVYPYSQTHITIVTIVNFKKRLGKEICYVDNNLIDLLIARICKVYDSASISLYFDSPVLTRSAAFIPVYDSTNSIHKIREEAYSFFLETGGEYDIDIPIEIHSTIMRFRREPENPKSFVAQFRLISETFPLCCGTISEILITEELQPYMTKGNIIRRLCHK